MKIALCLSGEARSFKQGYEYHKKNLLDHYDVDVYIHAWTLPEPDMQSYKQLYSAKVYQYENKPEMVGYNEKYPRTPEPENRPPWNAYCMFYSMYKCSQLVEIGRAHV